MARSYLGVEFGKSTHVEYAVYNRNTKELVFRHGVCRAGAPQVWFDKYEDADNLLNTALKYYPDDHILTIIKRTNTFEVVDTMP